MDNQHNPAVSDTVTPPGGFASDSVCGGPSRSGWLASAVAPSAGVTMAPSLVDLVADSLRAVCQDERRRDRVFQLMARAIDLHLADSVLAVRTGRWTREAMDALLGLLSEPLLREVRRHLGRADRADIESATTATGTSQPHR